jgi:hypothetical protein
MCDYSLHAVASRPAKIGERLVSTSFRGTSTRGFAVQDEPAVAICLLPGTELAFEQDVRYNCSWLSTKSTGFRVAQFCLTQKALEQHHDALLFPDGTIVLVNLLSEGQHARVLQLPATARGEKGDASAEHAPVESDQQIDSAQIELAQIIAS